MEKMPLHWPLAFAMVGLLAGPAAAQSLAQALEQTWSRYPLAVADSARASEAKFRAQSADSLLPGAASVSASLLNDQFNANRGRQELELELSMPLWLPGQKAARQAEAVGVQDDLTARQQALRLQLAAEVRDAWWSVAGARNAWAQASRRADSAQALDADVTRRFKAGELARVDANLAQGESLAAQAELSDAQTLLLQAEQAYRSLTGVAAPTALPGETLTLQRPLPAEHPQLAAAAANVKLAQARLKLVQESPREAPNLALRMVSGRADFAEPYTNAVGVKLTLPLSFGPRVRQENAAALAELAQSQADVTLLERKLALETERAQQEWTAAQRQLTLTQQRLALSADTLALAEKSFALGESDLASLLRARAAAFDAQALLSKQHINVAAAVSHINQAQGALP